MCGILAVFAGAGGRVSVDDAAVVRMRDRMSHRGPDSAGLWRFDHGVLAHRRLAVIDPTPGGHQPMVSADGRRAIVYNGELYNDGEVRAELAADGVVFRSSSDTETVLLALWRWGTWAMRRLRGMYAFVFVDLERARVIAARDPLGIKPLYWARTAGAGGGEEMVLASEIPAILGHPGIAARPDLPVISAYLTTIRTTLGRRTLFAGVSTLLPGEWMVADLAGDSPRVEHLDWWGAAAGPGGDVRSAVEDSVVRHLRADVPVCCLLSGGLDSSIIAGIAGRGSDDLSTYCAGAPDGAGQAGDDFSFARIMAERLGSRHVEVPVTRRLFGERWCEIVERSGVPLSTPNEVAINEVARRVRADGRIVALSGEGADELFGGYDTALGGAARHVAGLAGCRGGHWRESGGLFQLDSCAWIPRDAKGAVLSEAVARQVEGDSLLWDWYREEFARLGAQREDADPLQTHLAFLRRVNLAGLLLRLDSATMLESVEGRTPLADQAVAVLAESLPMAEKFVAGGDGGAPQTKRALRSAFGGDLPAQITGRAKASFPLPFQEWVADRAAVLTERSFAREVFSDMALATVAAEPARLWALAWPMINIALWGKRWW